MASTPPEFDPQQMSQQMKDSAQQIWQAGLGVLAKAQEEGAKVYQNQIAQAAEKMNDMANQLGESAHGQIDKLEIIFEKRVAKSIKSMGLPSAQEWADLQARVAVLEQQLAAAHNPKT